MSRFSLQQLQLKKYPWDWIGVLLIAVIFFWLQARFLGLSAHPDSDEGVYAEAGALMLHGLRPYVDFPLAHMPLLPFLIGVGLRITHSMFALRLIFLFLNTCAALPLYAVLKQLTRDRIAGLAGVFLYLSFHEMVHHDFRFLAIRQLANDLFILCLYLHFVIGKKQIPIYRISCIIVLQTLLFLPAALNTLIVLTTLIGTKVKKWADAYGSLLMLGGSCGITLLLIFLMFPHAFQESVLQQFARVSSERISRIGWIVGAPHDRMFIYLGILGLMIGSIGSRVRWLSLSLLATICLTIFLPTSYYPHYISLAGPALAIGVCILIASCRQWQQHVLSVRTLSVIATLLLFHLYHSLPSLLREWNLNRQPQYHEIIEALRVSPAPLLTLEPIYAAESGLPILLDPIDTMFRVPWQPRIFTEAAQEKLSEKACTIFLDSKAQRFFSINTQKHWLSTYRIKRKNTWGTILWTEHPWCPHQTAVAM